MNDIDYKRLIKSFIKGFIGGLAGALLIYFLSTL